MGEKQNGKNEEWYDLECREITEAKQVARMKCIQRNTRANQEGYSRKE
jgi:hypothetical protein